MNIKKYIRDALLPIGVPVYTLSASNTVDQYIILTEYNQAPSINADDDELSTKYFYQVDVYTKGDFTVIVKEVEDRLKQAGLKRMFSSETYDSDAQKFRKILRFSYATDFE